MTLVYVVIYTQIQWIKAHIGSEKLESGCVAVNTGVVALLKHHLVVLNKLVMDVKVDQVQLKIT